MRLMIELGSQYFYQGLILHEKSKFVCIFVYELVANLFVCAIKYFMYFIYPISAVVLKGKFSRDLVVFWNSGNVLISL